VVQPVLLVEPDDHLAAVLTQQVRGVADVHRHAEFAAAKAELRSTAFAFLVTNLRLRDHNGLQLVYLAATDRSAARAIVYTSDYDLPLAREVQHAGAFYETGECLTQAIATYLTGTLPDRDRRNPTTRERRAGVRGGRRCWDGPDAADHVV